MSLGHFAQAFAESFGDGMLDQQEQERRDKMAKLQGQLLELQIKAGENQQAGMEQVTDMMSGNALGEFQVQPDQGLGQFNITPGQVPEFEQTEGRNLPPVAQGMDPMSLSEMLADPEGQMAMLQAGMINVSDLIGSPRSNKTLDMMQAAGIDPKSEEGRALIEADIAGNKSDNFLRESMLSIQISQERERLAQQRRDRELAEKTERERVGGTRADMKKDFSHAREAFMLQQELEQTALQSGMPYGEMLTALASGKVAILGSLGFDVSKQQDLIAKRRRLEKLYADGTLNALDRFSGTGAVGRDKFRELQKSTPSILVPSQTNSLLFADRLEQMISAADIEGIEVDDRGEIESFIEELRSYTPGGPETVVDAQEVASDIAKWSKEKINSISEQQILQMGREEIDALERRLAELR